MSREKQIEGMIKAIEKCSCVYTPCEQECAQCSNEELYDEIINHIARTVYEAGYRKQEWISVEERLPGVSGRYICAVKDKKGHTWTVAADYSLEMKAWFGLMFGEIKNTVTHWMPLPEPPKMEGGE